MQGNASGGDRAKHAGRIANSLIDCAWTVIEQKSLLPEHPPSGSYCVHQFQFSFKYQQICFSDLEGNKLCRRSGSLS